MAKLTFGAIQGAVTMAEATRRPIYKEMAEKWAVQWLDENGTSIDNRCGELMRLLLRLDNIEYKEEKCTLEI